MWGCVIMIQDLKEIYKELEKVFGTEAVDKINSHFTSLAVRIEELIKSRDKWRKRALKK